MPPAARPRLFVVLFAAALLAAARSAALRAAGARAERAAAPARVAAARAALAVGLVTARDPSGVRSAAAAPAARTKVTTNRAAASVFAAYISARKRHARGIERERLGLADATRIDNAQRDANERREAVERRRSLAGSTHSWRGRPQHLYTGHTYRPPRALRSLQVPPERDAGSVLSRQEHVERDAVPASGFGSADEVPSPTPPTLRVARENAGRIQAVRAQAAHVHAHVASHAARTRMRVKDVMRIDARMCAALLVALCLAAAMMMRRRVAFERVQRALLRRLRRLRSPPRARDVAA